MKMKVWSHIYLYDNSLVTLLKEPLLLILDQPFSNDSWTLGFLKLLYFTGWKSRKSESHKMKTLQELVYCTNSLLTTTIVLSVFLSSPKANVGCPQPCRQIMTGELRGIRHHQQNGSCISCFTPALWVSSLSLTLRMNKSQYELWFERKAGW